ncbi:MAG: phytoene desaturase family protein, partial [Bacteroidota bacterium]
PAHPEEIYALFEHYEKGSSQRLKDFLAQSAYKYEVGINNLVYKPSLSLTEFVDFRLLVDMIRMNIFESFHKHIRRYFKHPKLIKLMEFPILFLGATPQNTPALYSLMDYADISLGTWYPMGGMFKIIEGMVKLAEEKGVQILYNQEVKELQVAEKKVTQVVTTSATFAADIVVAGADYHHVDQHLLAKPYQNYTEKYWGNRTMAPASLLFYLGVNKRLKNLRHHNLFFHEELMPHAIEIYENPKWPTRPLFYVSCPSQTDPTVAPEGMENIFVLMPVAPNLEDTEEKRAFYYDLLLKQLESLTGQSIREAVVYKRAYAHKDFVEDYNAFKGNAYGLANTLKQTAILKPSLKNKKLHNLYYTGQLTVPGPGVPPSLISGQVVAAQVMKAFSI